MSDSPSSVSAPESGVLDVGRYSVLREVILTKESRVGGFAALDRVQQIMTRFRVHIRDADRLGVGQMS